MNYDEFMRKLRKGEILPVYLFEGEEDYLKGEALKALKAKILPSEYEDFNYQVFLAPDSSSREIVESARTPSFKGGWRFIVAKEIDKFAEYDREILSNYLADPVNNTCLVCTAKKLDKRTKLYHLFLEKGSIVSFYPLRGNRKLVWAAQRVEKRGKRISPEALIYLTERVGDDLCYLDNEIEKLCIFVHPKDLIKKEDVEEVMGEGRGEGVFDLTEAFRKKELSRSLSILFQLLERGEDPQGIYSLIVREIRILLRIKGKEGRISPYQACPIIFGWKDSYSGFYTNIAKEYLQAVKNFSLSELISAYERLVEMEASIKTGREKPDIALENLIFELLSG